MNGTIAHRIRVRIPWRGRIRQLLHRLAAIGEIPSVREGVRQLVQHRLAADVALVHARRSAEVLRDYFREEGRAVIDLWMG